MSTLGKLRLLEEDSFISIDKAFCTLNEIEPKATVLGIAHILLDALKGNDHRPTVKTVMYCIYRRQILSDGELPYEVEELDPDWRYQEDTAIKIIQKLIDARAVSFDDVWTGFNDVIGWYKKDFLEALKDAGYNLEAHINKGKNQFLHTEPPAWFKPFLARSFLELEEATNTIYRLKHGEIFAPVIGEAEKYNDYKNCRAMLTDGVLTGSIKLDSNSSTTDQPEYWRLSIRDIKTLCDKVGYYFPLPVNNQGRDRTVENDPNITLRLEELEAENKALKEENEALEKKLNKSLCINPENELLPIEALVGIKAWIAVTNNGQKEEYKKSPKQQLKDKIGELKQSNPKEYTLSNTAIERISTIFNWKPDGGSPRTG